jgi:DNA-directed RNA polymerase subunit alpha
MDNTTMMSLDELLAKETWTIEDLPLLRSALFEVNDATEKFKDALMAIREANPELKGTAALKVGMGRYMLCQFADALDVLSDATDNRDRRWVQGLCFQALGQYDRAAEEFTRAGEKGTEADLVELKQAEVAALAGDLAAAAKGVAKLEKSMGDTAMFFYARGLVSELEGLTESAADDYEKALELDEDCSEAMFRLAYFHDLHGDEDLARDLYLRCTSRAPVHANALLNLAVLYEDSGDYDRAIAAIRRVLANNTNHARAQMLLKDCQSSKEMFYDEDHARRQAFCNAVLDTPVTDFELSVRARNCLKKMNIRTLGDLVRTSESTLMSYKNFGETSLKEIKDMLAAKGLKLGQALDDASAELGTFTSARAPWSTPPADASDEVLATPVTQVEFSIRVRRVLDTLHIQTLGDLASKTEVDLMSCSNFGQTSVNEVHAKLSEYGLKLAELG